MSDYSSLKAAPPPLFATEPAPKPSVDPDHMASRDANELANRAAVTIAGAKSTELAGPVNVGGLNVTPGQPVPQFMVHERTGKPIPMPGFRP